MMLQVSGALLLMVNRCQHDGKANLGNMLVWKLQEKHEAAQDHSGGPGSGGTGVSSGRARAEGVWSSITRTGRSLLAT